MKDKMSSYLVLTHFLVIFIFNGDKGGKFPKFDLKADAFETKIRLKSDIVDDFLILM